MQRKDIILQLNKMQDKIHEAILVEHVEVFLKTLTK